jgi:hypothetical protein
MFVPAQTTLCRQPLCTHTTTERLYGRRCGACGRIPPLGWVFKCTQDCGRRPPATEVSRSALPEAGSTEQTEIEAPWRNVEHEPDCHADGLDGNGDIRLKPWMEKAIAQGHYTASQIDVLRDQRRGVLRTIGPTKGDQSGFSPTLRAHSAASHILGPMPHVCLTHSVLDAYGFPRVFNESVPFLPPTCIGSQLGVSRPRTGGFRNIGARFRQRQPSHIAARTRAKSGSPRSGTASKCHFKKHLYE